MSWFSKPKGGPEQEKPKEEKQAPSREFERIAGSGERVLLLQDGVPIKGADYLVKDISLGGFSVDGYEGGLKGNQYFEFKMSCAMQGKPKEIEGFANVVRVKDGMLAAKFTPQPRLKNFMREYLESK